MTHISAQLCSPDKQLSTLNYVTDPRSAFALPAHVEGADGGEVLYALTHNVWRHHGEAHQIFLWSPALLLAARGHLGLPELLGGLALPTSPSLGTLSWTTAISIAACLVVVIVVIVTAVTAVTAVIAIVVIGVGVGNVVFDLDKCGVG